MTKEQATGNTRSVVLDLIRSERVVSRVDLAEKSGLGAASITRIVKSLISDGLVIETGFGDSTGGKRPTLLELNPSSRYAVGLSLDDAQLTYVVTDMAGALVGKLVTPGRRSTPRSELIGRILSELDLVLQQTDVDRTKVVGLGIAVSGAIESAGVLLPEIGESVDPEPLPLQRELEEATGFAVLVEHDSACAALGEFWAGRIPATRDFVTVFMATGIGCGIVIKGGVYRGSSANSGKLGHMIVAEDGPECICGARGCVEALAAPYVVVREARANAALSKRLGLGSGEAAMRGDFARIAMAASRADPTCAAMIESSAEHLARALVSLVNVLDVDHLYLAGPAFADAGSLYLRIIRERLDAYAFLRAVHPVHIELSRVGPDAPALGAAAVLLQSELTPRNRALARA